jgi:hypothetical protein
MQPSGHYISNSHRNRVQTALTKNRLPVCDRYIHVMLSRGQRIHNVTGEMEVTKYLPLSSGEHTCFPC